MVSAFGADEVEEAVLEPVDVNDGCLVLVGIDDTWREVKIDTAFLDQVRTASETANFALLDRLHLLVLLLAFGNGAREVHCHYHQT